MHDLKRFQAYQLAVQLHRECEAVHTPSYLRDQMLRASSSVVLNIAEGSGKPSVADRRRFYGIALGSLREVQAALDLSRASAELIQRSDRVAAIVYRLVHPKVAKGGGC